MEENQPQNESMPPEAITNEITEEKPEPVKVVEDPRAFCIPFIKDIRSIFAKADIEKYLWITKTGLFVKEDFRSQLVAGFIEWFAKSNQASISLDKAIKKLFEREAPQEFYLILGSSVVVGNHIGCVTKDLRGAGIRLYEGIPLDTETSMHHTDPIFFETDRLSVQLTKQGYTAQIKTKQLPFSMNFDGAAVLRRYFKESGDQKKYIDTSSIRSFIKTFSASLSHAKPLSLKTSVLFPVRFTHRQGESFFVLGNSILVEKAEMLVDAFPMQGKGFDRLVRDELQELAKEFGRKRLAGAGLSIVKDSFLAHYDILGIHHTFGISAMFSFLRAVQEYVAVHRKLPGRLKDHTTVREIIPEITGLLRDAQPCLPDKIPAKIRDEVLAHGTGLCGKGGEWYFAVDRGKMIREIFYLQKQEKKPIEIIHPQEKI